MTLQLWERSSHFFFYFRLQDDGDDDAVDGLLRVGAGRRYRVGGRGRACPKEKKKKREKKKNGEEKKGGPTRWCLLRGLISPRAPSDTLARRREVVYHGGGRGDRRRHVGAGRGEATRGDAGALRG